MASTPAVLKLAMLVASMILTAIYGTLGTILTFLLFLRVGPTKFFSRVPRPTPPAQATDPIYGKHEMIKLKSSGVTLHYVSKGSPNQPLMLFVHGFPECWYAWRYQMKYFSKNYRVVAIDQRGYGLSSKPTSVADYKLEVLARDVADIIEQLSYKSCILVAHDWGGVVAWAVAILYPNLIDRLIIMNAPHSRAFRNSLSLAQLRRSWYIFFYQIPFIPELLIQANDFATLKRIFYTKPSGLINTDNMMPYDFEVFKYTFSQKGTTTAAVNYYRALVRYQSDESAGRVTVPVLIIWGCRDVALGEELAEASRRCCDYGQVKKIPNASHWVQQDAPDEVNGYMEAFLNEKSPT